MNVSRQVKELSTCRAFTIGWEIVATMSELESEELLSALRDL